ncbi:MAG: Exodeoxyribonuclease 7 large subunit [Legionellaceae bacterium]
MQTVPEKVFTISQLNQAARILLEDNFPQIWVEGEISNLAKPTSGHIYFSLKDNQAQIRCAMFAMRCRSLTFSLQNGQHVIVKGKLSLYEGRGDYQLIVETIEEVGSGALQRAYEALKQCLALEGLFDQTYKKNIPRIPKAIGIITSPTGAAIRDILSVLKRRFALIPIYIYPTQVQGQLAAEQIVNAIRIANEQAICDVLIIARGGGSIEDLWPFNEEIVARSIFASQIPIVSGIGHEIDFTIADFVADQRAPTPSAAAELCSLDKQEQLLSLTRIKQFLQQQLQVMLNRYRENLLWLSKRVQHPGQRLQEQSQRLDETEQRLFRANYQKFQQVNHAATTLHTQLEKYIPSIKIENLKIELKSLEQRLHQIIEYQFNQEKMKLSHFSHNLAMVNPLATLSRGYAIARTVKTKEIITHIEQIALQETISIQLCDGQLICIVNEKNTNI